MYCRYLALDDNKVEDFPIGSIVVFPESQVFRIGIVVDYYSDNKVMIMYGEYYRAEKPTQLSGRTMCITRNFSSVFHAKENDYDMSKVEYLLSVYNKEKKKNVELIKKLC